MSEQTIKFIFVQPRNKFYAQYMINDNQEVHTMKYDDLFNFIVKMIPSQSGQLRDMFDRFRSFFVSVEDGVIEELIFDFPTERKKLSDNLKSYNLTAMVREIKAEKENPKPERRYQNVIDWFSQKKL